jgi:hypothetical protein
MQGIELSHRLEAEIYALSSDELLRAAQSTPPEAQAYIDAEERALAADGDVLDANEFDPTVDEVDASEAVGDWEQDAGQFKFALEAE